ncbi:MAG: DUF58 domain-containing protein [Planctomycetales bacterium]|nr:DUF58 domain-containing protein [Planctomycetales bacterium]
MLGSVSGRHRSPHRGSSVEFAEYRKYVPGDDPRRLDWRAYGRTDRFYVKEFEADTNLRLMAVMDTSGSMRYQGTDTTKLEYGKRLLSTLMYLASQQGDAIGLTCAAKGIDRQVPTRRSGAHLRAVLDELTQIEAQGDTGLVAALHAVAEQTPQRALVVIVSDLFVSPAELADCFQHLRFRRHDVAVFHLLEDQELDFRFDRPTRFVDLEGGPSLLVEPNVIHREYAAALQQYLHDLDVAVREAAIDYHRVRINESYGEVLARFLIGRTPRRAGR